MAGDLDGFGRAEKADDEEGQEVLSSCFIPPSSSEYNESGGERLIHDDESLYHGVSVFTPSTSSSKQKCFSETGSLGEVAAGCSTSSTTSDPMGGEVDRKIDAERTDTLDYKAYYVPLSLRQLKILLLSHLIPRDNIKEFMRIAHLTLDDNCTPLKVVEDIALEHPAPFNQLASRDSRVVHRSGFRDIRHWTESNANMSPNKYFQNGVPSGLSRRSTTFGVPPRLSERHYLTPISRSTSDLLNSIRTANDHEN